jgi:hypothetical protein
MRKNRIGFWSYIRLIWPGFVGMIIFGTAVIAFFTVFPTLSPEQKFCGTFQGTEIGKNVLGYGNLYIKVGGISYYVPRDSGAMSFQNLTRIASIKIGTIVTVHRIDYSGSISEIKIGCYK